MVIKNKIYIDKSRDFESLYVVTGDITYSIEFNNTLDSTSIVVSGDTTNDSTKRYFEVPLTPSDFESNQYTYIVTLTNVDGDGVHYTNGYCMVDYTAPDVFVDTVGDDNTVFQDED